GCRGNYLIFFGAEAGTRTPTPLRALDPESSASANSATSARLCAGIIASSLLKSRSLALGIEKVVATNRKARHEFEVLETFEAGLVLRGTAVKSLREGQSTSKASYATVENGEAWLIGCHVTP